MEKNDKLRVFENGKGFVMVDGKLQEITWLRTTFRYHHKEDNVMYYTSVTKFKKPDGTTDALDDYSRAFDSVEHYEKGILASMRDYILPKDKNSGCIVYDIINGRKSSYSPEYWVFDKCYHTPVKYELEYEEFYYDYSDRSFHSDELLNGCDIYDTKDECLSYNTYKVVNADGTEYERDGINRLVMLDEDQRELVKEFEEVCKKMSESGMYLLADYDYLCAYNFRKIEDFALHYEKVPDVDDPELYENVDRYAKPFRVGCCIEFYGDDNKLFVKRK